MKYFVMINHPNGKPLPLIDDDENVLYFKSFSEAKTAAQSNSLADHYGFEVFLLGAGEL